MQLFLWHKNRTVGVFPCFEVVSYGRQDHNHYDFSAGEAQVKYILFCRKKIGIRSIKGDVP